MWECVVSTVQVRVIVGGVGQDDCTGDVGVSQSKVRVVGVGLSRRRKELRTLSCCRRIGVLSWSTGFAMSPLPLVLDGLEAFLLKHRGGLRCGQGSQFRGLTAFSQDHGLGVTIGCVQVFAVAQQISVQLWRVNVGLELLNKSKAPDQSQFHTL